MTKRSILTGLALLVVSYSPVPAQNGGRSAAPEPFAVATIHFEQNATDSDAEVVVEAKGGDEGLVSLNVVSPDGRTVIEFSAPGPATTGIRQFLFESPEPQDMAVLTSAYPEGAYTFAGTTASGSRLHGTATLSHTLPKPVTLLQPKGELRDLNSGNVEIRWTPVRDMAGYVVFVEQDDLGVNVTATLPGSANAFIVPKGFLQPGTAYALGIGARTANGNISFIETTFTTAGEP